MISQIKHIFTFPPLKYFGCEACKKEVEGAHEIKKVEKKKITYIYRCDKCERTLK
jgi:predicted SprT family Zn-dependent metalloprotease